MKTTVEGAVTTTLFEDNERSIKTVLSAECRSDRHEDCRGLQKVQGEPAICVCVCHLVKGGN